MTLDEDYCLSCLGAENKDLQLKLMDRNFGLLKNRKK
jgi:hypothetical protein